MVTTTQARYTPEDLLAITDRPMPELVDGQLVERAMGQRADAVAARIVWILMTYAKATLPGLVNGAQCGYQIFPDDPTKVRIPDASFTRRDRLPDGAGAEGHARVVPDLVIEVISPNDQAADLLIKVREYLEAGVPWIWVVNPDDRTVQTYRAGGAGALLGPHDRLDGGETLAGFQCPVAALFE